MQDPILCTAAITCVATCVHRYNLIKILMTHEQRVGGYPTYHRIVASDTNPPKHKLIHTVKENEDGSLLVEVLGKHLHSTTTPALNVLDKLPRHTSLQRKVKIIDNLKICIGNEESSFIDLADKNGQFFARRKLSAKLIMEQFAMLIVRF